MRTVERINVTFSVSGLSPPCGLDRAAYFQRQLIKILLVFIERYFPLSHQPPEISVSGDVVEAVVMDAYMRHVRRHALHRFLSANLQKLFFAGSVELEQG